MNAARTAQEQAQAKGQNPDPQNEDGEVNPRNGDDEGLTASIVSPGEVKVRRPASGRNYIDVAVPKSLTIAIPGRRAELRLIEHVDGLPVFAIPPGVLIEEPEG